MVREVLTGKTMNEELDSSDYDVLRDLIRREVALIFFDLFKKRATWK